MEDEALIAMDVEQLCRECGALDVLVVRSVQQVEADSLAASGFNAAILDVMLSGSPTVDFARTLTQHGIPFVFATGYADQDQLFHEFPDIPVVGKPYVGADLVNALAGEIARNR
jgi:CheY-like chemotaxis protein